MIVLDKKIFKVFISKIYLSPCDLEMQRTGLLNSYTDGHISIIPVKFGKNPASSLGGDVL